MPCMSPADTLGPQGRYIVAPTCLTPMDMAAALKPVFPTLSYPKMTAPKFALYLLGPLSGVSWSFVKHNVGQPLEFDCSKAERDLRMQFRDVRAALVEMVRVGLESGIIKK